VYLVSYGFYSHFLVDNVDNTSKDNNTIDSKTDQKQQQTNEVKSREEQFLDFRHKFDTIGTN
jgi:hypothetical protein